jgi:glyoxylase-like metal-dependent hydrolase (beta-lactamase superfamily II)
MERGLVIDDIHRIRCSLPIHGATVNIYFAKDPVPTLIDAPPEGPKYLEELDAGLKSLGSSVEDIRRIIVTHPHFDHYGAARTISEGNGAEIWASKKGACWMEEHEEELRNLEVYRTGLLEKAGVSGEDIRFVNQYYSDANRFASGAQITRYLQDGDRFELASLRFAVTEVPGHTPFCILLHNSEGGLGFTGDLLPQGIASLPLVQWIDLRSPGYMTLKSYMGSLKKVREMNLRAAFPGHGKILRNPAESADSLLRLIAERQKKVCWSLQKGSRTAIEIVRELLQNCPREGLFRAVSDVMGHLGILEEEGLVERTDGIPVHFRWIKKEHGVFE